MYEWIKALHVLAVISWMAALLYLPRLMVYHVDAEIGSRQDETFKVMERRLKNAIMRPAGLVALVTGGGLMHLGGIGFGDWWFLVKFLTVGGLFVAQGFMERHVRQFTEGKREKSSRYFRILNEVPTVLMIVIVIMVIVKPF
jgi:protoporphyrinogen IX oxidase